MKETLPLHYPAAQLFQSITNRDTVGHLVMPLASLSHMSTKHHGSDAETFNGLRWVESGKGAAMINEGYFPFGLGRWACPGRVLAVSGKFPSNAHTLDQLLSSSPRTDQRIRPKQR